MNANQQTQGEVRVAEEKLFPRCEIWETSDAVHVSAEMPGVADQAMQVSVERNVLSITGRIEAPASDGWKCVHGGLSRGVFERSFQLSNEIDTSAIRASAANGILTLALPKRVQKRVTVNVG